MSTKDQTHALYRFHNNAGALLYIGITMNPAQRWAGHSADKPWWHDVATISIETFPDRDAVLAAERAAIIAEKPLHNVVHNRGNRDGGITQLPVTDRLAPFQAGDFAALGLNTGRCPVGMIEAVTDHWISLRLISFASGCTTDRIEVVRADAILQTLLIYPEDLDSIAEDDNRFGQFQDEWKARFTA